MSNGRKFTIEFKVKAVKLAKKLGRPVASLMVLILTWMKRNTRLELGNKWLMYYPY